jgi:hypothetical protein
MPLRWVLTLVGARARVLVTLTLTLTLTASDVAAQDVAIGPPAQVAPHPPPEVVPDVAHAPVVHHTPARTVRIRARSEGGKHPVRVEMRNDHRLVCASQRPVRAPQARGTEGAFTAVPWGDCVADVPPGSQLLVTLGESKHAGIFDVHSDSDADSEQDLLVLSPADRGETAGGVVMIVVGGLGAAVGLLVLGTSAEFDDESRTRGGAAVVLAFGVLLGAGGIAVLANRAREPRLERQSTRRELESQGRRETLLGDVASSKSREATLNAPSPALSYGFSF